MTKLRICSEFRDAIQPLSGEELAQLEANIKSHGCRDPLVIWDGFIIDGHHRYEICTRQDIPFQTVTMDFPDRASVKVWMLHNQLGRRNLNDFQRSEIALQLEDILKEQAKERQLSTLKQNAVTTVPQNSAERNDAGNTDILTGSEAEPLSIPQSPAPRQERETRAAVAKTAGVSHDTVKKVKAIRDDAIPEVQNLARSGSVSIHAASKIADLPEETQEEIAEEITAGAKPTEALKKHVHVAQNGGENEWYTPADIIESARKAMGGIDCDPASSPLANETVKASEFFTKEDDGLSKEWRGNIWMNPPYAQPLIAQFAEAVASKYEAGEFEQAIILVNNATETQWFQRLLAVASGVCFPSSRIRFLSPDGKKGSPLQGQAILYVGSDYEAFGSEFQRFGQVLPRCGAK